MLILRYPIRGALLLLSLFSGLVFVPAVSAGGIVSGVVVSDDTPTHYAGRLSADALQFSADDAGKNSVRVVIGLLKKSFVFDFSVQNGDGLSLRSFVVRATDKTEARKTADDQKSILQANAYLSALDDEGTSLSRATAAAFDILAGMVPQDVDIPAIRPHAAPPPAAVAPSSFSAICAARGTKRVGLFDDDKNVRYKVAGWVGSPSNSCLGRCGPGCTSGIAKHDRQYTQECLNHDLCSSKYNTWFGPCADEWTAAIDGYLQAKSCDYNVVGTWKLYYTWSDSIQVHTYAYIYANGTLRTTDGLSGTWTRSGSTFKLNVAAGCYPTYTGTVASSNLAFSGKMTCTKNTDHGVFAALYRTTEVAAANASIAPVDMTQLDLTGRNTRAPSLAGR